MSLWNKLIKPMLAYSSKPFDSQNFIFEIKFDGTRCIAYVDVENRKVKFLNRRMKFFHDRYPELQEIWKDVKAKKVILDGEIVVFEKGKPNFQKLAEREQIENKARIELLAKIMPAIFIVFDILYLDGEDLINLTLQERKKILERVVVQSERILQSEYVVGKGKEFFRKARQLGLEGVVAKKLDSVYELATRSRNWLKIKSEKTIDCVIAGYTLGAGWREKYFGALILGVYRKGKLHYIGRVGTGWDENFLQELKKKLEKIKTKKMPFEEEPKFPSGIVPVWVKPKLVCEVKFMQLTKDFMLRAPSFVRMRTDKEPEECILEI
jgi:bifunctional non-homologous end joining protein LigD